MTQVRELTAIDLLKLWANGLMLGLLIGWAVRFVEHRKKPCCCAVPPAPQTTDR